MTRKDRTVYRNKLGSLIKRRLYDILLNDADDRRFATISVKRLQLNSDMSLATVFVETYDNTLDKAALIAALNKASGFFHILLKKSLHLKRIPNLEFKYDHSTEYYFQIGEVIEDLKDNDSSEIEE
ncbi:30S ribosome-binding factor RbfA [bacterium]|nr:30S ribosome-binding factor RbfA [bacterium]